MGKNRTELLKHIPTDHVEAGAVLAADLLDKNGFLILSLGATLTESVIKRLNKMGIQQIPIEMDNPEQIKKEKDQLLASIECRFRGTEENPLLQELKRIAITHVMAE